MTALISRDTLQYRFKPADAGKLIRRRSRRALGMQAIEALEDRRLLTVYLLQGVTPAPAPVEGQALASATLASFASSSAPGGLAATIDWGDGSGPTPGIVSVSGSVFVPGLGTAPQYTVSGGHTYAAGTGGQSFPISVVVTDSSDSTFAGIFDSTTVGRAAVIPNNPQPTVLAAQGTPFSNVPVANFTDANSSAVTGDFAATINWGDGSAQSAGTITQPGGIGTPFVVTGGHTYGTSLGSPFAVTVTIHDLRGGNTVVTTTTATVTAATVGVSPVANTPPQIEARAFTGSVASFTTSDAQAGPSDFAPTITWGDGTTSPGVVSQLADGTFTVSGTHTYAQFGSYNVTVGVLDRLSGVTTAISGPTIETVFDAALSSHGAPISGIEGTALPASTVVATFTDANPASNLADFTAAINWGDGTALTPGSIVKTGVSPNGVIYAVQGSHTYTNKGNYQVVVGISSVGGSETQAVSNAALADAPPSVSPINFSTTVDQQFSRAVAAFSENYGPPTGLQPGVNYTATIDWGDGTAPAIGNIIGIPGGYEVHGVHTYLQSRTVGNSNQFPVTVTVHDNGGAIATVVSTATVNDVPLTGMLNPSSDSGASNTDAVTNVAQPNFQGTAQALTTIQLFAAPAGTMSYTLVGQASSDGSGAWSITTNLLADGKYTIQAREIDPSGNLIATTTILPNSGQGPLVIDTVGPRVTSLALDRLHGQINVGFSDNLSGLDPAELNNSANYRFGRRHVRSKVYQVTGISTTTSADALESSVILTINRGRGLRGGSYLFTILSGSGATGVRDVAGNALDGEFYGTFPSGNGRRGGDFVAVIDTIHHTIYPPRSVIGIVGPLGPGTRPGRVRIPTVNPGRPIPPQVAAIDSGHPGFLKAHAARVHAKPAAAKFHARHR